MVDVHDKLTRSRNMSAIKSSGTRPESLISKTLFSRGYRYRKNVKSLPGTPDLVLKKYKTCIFVHGCFWHMHDDCPLFKLPKSRTEFWEKKLSENKSRDRECQIKLTEKGWKVIVIWECALKGSNRLTIEEVIKRTTYLMNQSVSYPQIYEIR